MRRIAQAEAQASEAIARAAALVQGAAQLSGAESPLLIKLLSLDSLIELARGDVLIREGDMTATELYVLISGSLAVESKSSFILRVDQPGDIVGEIAVLQAPPRTADVIAESDALVAAIPQEALARPEFGELDAVFNKLLARSVVNKLRATTSQMLKQRGAATQGAGARADAEKVQAILKQEWPQLTSRELEVLQLFAKGYNYEEVGRALDLSINTVGTHVRHIYRKLGVGSKSEAILEALELGLVLDPGSRRR